MTHCGAGENGEALRASLPGGRAGSPSLGALDGRAAILLDGAVQSVAVDGSGDEPEGYWRWLLPDARPESVLLLGLGGGTVAQLLSGRFAGDPPRMTGVEDDAGVLALGRAALGLDQVDLRVVVADAREYLSTGRTRVERFDLVVVDLFRDGGIPDFVCSRRFLSLVAGALEEGGLLTINLNRGASRTAQVRRLRRCFEPQRAIGAGMNLVVHARPRPRRHYQMRAP